MVVVLMSRDELEGLLKARPSLSQGLKEYLASAARMESLLPDENLPATVLLERLEHSERGYTAVVRTYADGERADRAWEAAGVR